MANIPTVPGRQVSPERGPVVYQNPGETRGAFGEASAEAGLKTAEGLQKTGAILAQAANERALADHRLDQRQDVIASAQMIGLLNQRLADLYNAEKNHSGFTSVLKPDGTSEAGEERLRAFRQRVDDEVTKAIGKGDPSFKTDEGFLSFQADARRLAETFHGQAVNEGLEQGRKVVQAQVGETLAKLTQQVATGKLPLDSADVLLREEIEKKLAKSEPPAQVAAYYAQAREHLAVMTAEAYLSRNLPQQAKNLLEERVAMGWVRNPVTIATANAKIIENETKFDRKLDEGRRTVQVLEAIDPGISKRIPDLAGRVIAGAFGVSLPATELKPLDAQRKVQLWEQVNNQKAPPAIWNRALDLEEKEKPAPYGRTPRGRAREKMDDTEWLLRLNSNTATLRDKLDLLNVAADYAEKDPDTGRLSVLPPHIQEALTVAGFDANTLQRAAEEGSTMQWLATSMSQLADTAPPTGPQAAHQQSLARVGELAERAVEAVSAAQAKAAGRENPDGVGAELKARNLSFFSMVDTLTGFESTAKNLGFGIVGIGATKWFDQPTIRSLRQSYDTLLFNLAIALNRTPRYADAAREDIRQEVLKPLAGDRLLENPEALRASLVGLDDTLAVDEQFHRELLKENLPTEERQKRKEDLNNIRFVRKMLSIPPRVRTDAELYQVVRTQGLKAGDPLVHVRADGSIAFIQVPPEAVGK